MGLWTGTDAVDAAFGEVDEVATRCRFTDCGHDDEPGCAVAEARARGELDPDRLGAWRALRREAAALERRASPQEQRRWGKQFARLSKDAQRRKARG